MIHFPKIITKRLSLGRIQYDDIPNIVTKANCKEIADNTLHLPYPYKEEDAMFWYHMQTQGYQQKSNYIFAIKLLENNEFIGGVGLHIDATNHKAELGYWISKEHWNMGFATEAASAVLKFGFESLHLNKIFASHFSKNIASEKVIRKLKMSKEAYLKNHILKNEKYIDIVMYGLTKKDFDISL